MWMLNDTVGKVWVKLITNKALPLEGTQLGDNLRNNSSCTALFMSHHGDMNIRFCYGGFGKMEFFFHQNVISAHWNMVLAIRII
ncbi:hypothetical protein FRX31_034908 [Thalictrum thalictroides]|uniref:Uncharacterized protein n=1 Tax=Thalictrum thalictroides TaxID=46969 RepID=A0A7J6UTM9_THATH|nr:hypothetical protein FRX31_034908 [Thalictrum thalictroides]